MSEVLALKYRPKNFDSLIGQDSITQTLSLALSNKRLSHAYLFSGLRGSGKTSTARIFSKALVCDNGPTSTPCEVCENCKMANESRHLDIIEMDAASSRKIDDIRDLIEHTKYKPNVARFKIFIIDEVHMLTREAFNALLKTLEEPPEYVKFILATTDPLKLPATILSRTQHFRFKQIAKNDIVHHLSYILNKEEISYEIEALEIISRAGGGSLRDSLTLLDQAIIFSKSNITPNQVASMLGLLDTKKLDEIFEALFNEDRQKILSLIQELESYEGEIILEELVNYVKEKFYAQDSRFSMLLSERFFRILSEAKQLLFINADSGFVLSLVFFKMLEAMNIKKIDNLIASMEKEKFEVPQQKELEHPKTQNQAPIQTSPKQTLNPKPQTTNTQDNRFEHLIKKLYDRNYELGECFEKSVEFVDFKENVLSLRSLASDECRKTLRHSSGVIKHFVQDTYGIDTKISMQQTSQEETKKKSIAQKIKEEMNQQTTPDTPQNNQAQTKEEEIKSLLESPLVSQAKELFKPKKIKVINKG